ncbi:MAG: VWA domain-containing protein [Gammaproteobacteria bacterium]
MKSKIIAIALFGLTAAAVLTFPVVKGKLIQQPGGGRTITPVTLTSVAPKVEVVFVLDTTGSMSGLIDAAKEKIWSIATTMASAQPTPEIRMGLVAYRDRGDAYVTRVVDLSQDLDSMYATLMDFQADGGGDTPESVNQALADAIHSISWSQGDDIYKVVFLVGDAPPHMDYPDDVNYVQTLAVAEKNDIVVNTVQCGDIGATVAPWQSIASLGNGRYFQVEQAGSALAMTTPYDEQLARLSAELDATRMFYGDEETQERMKHKMEATDKLHAMSSVESRARRAKFNASAAGEANKLGDNELVNDVATGRVDLSDIDAALLPAPMRELAPEEQKDLIAKTAAKRSELERQIKEIAGKRDNFIDEKVELEGGGEESLDFKIYEAVKEQGGERGLRYESGPDY